MRHCCIQLLPFLALLAVLVPGRGLAAPGRAAFVVTRFDDRNSGQCAPGDCSLREAVIAANGAPGADEILVPGGTYSLTIAGRGENAAATGDLDLTGDVTITGAGAWQTIVNASGASDRTFQVLTATVTIAGMTIRGGGPDICPVYAQVFDRGGGGIFSAGTLTVSASVIEDNWACEQGGGIYTQGTLTLLDSTVRGNHLSWSYGAGVNGSGFARIERSSILSNTVDAVMWDVGGGGIAFSGTLAVAESLVAGNVAATDVGLGQDRAQGGGIYLRGGALVMTNTTVSQNRVDVDLGFPGSQQLSAGGGLYVAAPAELNNVTIASNQATGLENVSGGGIYAAAEPVALRNTLLAGNAVSSGGSGPDCAGTLLSRDYNLITDLSGCALAGATAHTVIGRDPLLGPLCDNGGGTWTHALLAGSPARERGDDATCAPTDQRGVPRPQGFACDIGAFEAEIVYVSRMLLPVAWR